MGGMNATTMLRSIMSHNRLGFDKRGQIIKPLDFSTTDWNKLESLEVPMHLPRPMLQRLLLLEKVQLEVILQMLRFPN